MPFIRIEYTDNIQTLPDFPSLFQATHACAAQHLAIDIARCKSHAHALNTYMVGEGEAHHAFIHITVAILPAWTDEVRQALAADLLAIYRTHFSAALRDFTCQLSLSLDTLPPMFVKATTPASNDPLLHS
jgi:5-carboxymethyl-2-hydroxymuconate isomerase